MSPTLTASLAAWSGEARALAERIYRALSLPSPSPAELDALFLDVHRWQHAHAPVVAALTGPVPAAHFSQIPAVPVSLYKDLPVGTLGPDEPCRTLLTSGTTGSGRGAHRMRSTALYDHGSLTWARQVLPGAPADIVALLSDPALAPESSLSHMVGLFPTGLQPSAPGRVSWHLVDGKLDVPSVQARLTGAGPVFLCCTAFALAEWLESGAPALPPGSWVMVTGGFKGRVVRFDEAELLAATQSQLQPARLVLEYGMTELSSQLWGEPGQPYAPPPWLRVVAADPLTGLPLPHGQAGQLRFYDLANLDASLGVETMDEGVVHADGRVTLHGRIAGAPARGCSLTVEEAWGS